MSREKPVTPANTIYKERSIIKFQKFFFPKNFKMRKEVLYLLLILPVQTYGQSSIPNETWNYVEIRTNAHMFWWLHGAQSQQRDKLPLALWLQGGPRGSGTGFGNFEEIGPLNLNQTTRTTTWIQKTNLLFITTQLELVLVLSKIQQLTHVMLYR